MWHFLMCMPISNVETQPTLLARIQMATSKEPIASSSSGSSSNSSSSSAYSEAPHQPGPNFKFPKESIQEKGAPSSMPSFPSGRS